MTHPTTIWLLKGNEAVEHGQDGETSDAAPNLAAIEHSYEQAKASIVDPAHSATCADEREPYPETEMIDVRAVALPAVPDGTSGTEAMSVAARFLAEQLVREELGSPESAPARPQAPPAPSPGRRGWWRGRRTALHDAVPEARSES